MSASSENCGLISSLVGDGTPLLAFTALCLMLSGWFALFLTVFGQFLPHDAHFLGMKEEELCGLAGCRVLKFMFHDRASFGGALIAIGWLYLWLVQFPLRRREAWAWWMFLISGTVGFASFLGYLSYGYLDLWHGIATAFLLPLFAVGMARSWRLLPVKEGPRSLRPRAAWPQTRAAVAGRILLLFTAGGLLTGGTVIFVVGCTSVFVDTDLRYIGLTAEQMQAINARLVPLIAHDRAGFGGAIATCGFLFLGCIWRGEPSKALWEAVSLAGVTGFASAIGVHPAIGYTEFIHLAPAVAGAIAFLFGIALCYRPMRYPQQETIAAAAR